MNWSRVLAVCAAGLALWCGSVAASVRETPNLLVIFTDDQGWADLGCQGVYGDVRTPNIDELARTGLRCTAGYVTAPQCVPSRAGLLTGMYQNRFGVESNRVVRRPGGLAGFNEQLTLAERLRELGYVTGMAGKWHLGPVGEIPRHGFDYVYARTGRGPAWSNFDTRTGKRVPGRARPDREYHVDACTRAACAFIRANRDRPFFFYLAYRAPHVPLDPPPRYLRLFPTARAERRRRALAMLFAVDKGVGQILRTLRECGLERKTLVFFLSDNGAPLKMHREDAPGIGPGWDGSLNDPFNGEKGMLTEGGIRVPFIVRWPGRIQGGRVYDGPVISLDIAATILAVVEGQKPAELDGANLLELLENNAAARERTLYWRWEAQAAVRKGKWKLILAGPRTYLFDLDEDGGEHVNLATRHPEVVQSLRKELQRWAGTLRPPGLSDQPLTGAPARFFDFYLGRKVGPNRSRAATKGSGSHSY